MNRATEQRRLTDAGWRAIPRGYLPANEVLRIEESMRKLEAERLKILGAEKKRGRPPRAGKNNVNA